ncbi:crossover junction endodeoxyribonuclease RuvC [Streptomyces alboflavus]|uniref:crossover junction endodeoxyribonuclease RuvC n=1 Tax=Streptomyces alboflavus TaxID=67267 RepID=UPI000F657C23|nr:crossover junction endodeoxyribonuclease RuvC [Streptomyces alboflavus]
MSTIPGLLAPGSLTPAEDFVTAPTGLRVLGLDLSLTSTGVCLPDGTSYRIKTRDRDGDRRLVAIRDNIREALAEHRPHLAVIEDLPKHAMSAGLTAQVHGPVKCELIDADVPFGFVVPATLKSFACDNGRADKREMAAAAYLAAGAEFPGDLNARGEGGDMCDAWWLRAAGHDWVGRPLFALPRAQRDRLVKAKWPSAYRQRYVMGVAA